MEKGYTVFELIVTVLIVVVLAATIGMFFTNLLTIQEQDREEAYVREKLADLCAIYADFASIGSSFSISSNSNANIVSYRLETGGISFETGRVSRVAYFTTATTNRAMNVDVYSLQHDGRSLIFQNEKAGLTSRWDRVLSGDVSLLIQPTGKLDVKSVTCTITPLGIPPSDHVYGVPDENFVNFNNYTDTCIGNLKVEAWYTYKNSRRELVLTNVAAERLVRLWNHD